MRFIVEGAHCECQCWSALGAGIDIMCNGGESLRGISVNPTNPLNIQEGGAVEKTKASNE